MRAPRLLALAVLVAPAVAAQRPPTAPDSSMAAQEAVLPTPPDRWSALPLRSVREVAALRPGLRRDLATGTLVFRSALGREPVFVVDGVRRLGGPLGDSPLALLGAHEGPFSAVETVDVLGSFVPASVGEAGGSVVLVETSAGRSVFGGRAEGLSSEATDAYGTSIASATLRGPLGRIGGLSVTGEMRRQSDALPSAGSSVRLADEARARLAASPQVIEVADGSGATRLVPFPTAAALAAIDAGRPFGPDDVRATLPAGTTLVGTSPQSAAETLAEADLERVRAQDDPLRDLSLTAQAELRPADAVRLSVGGSVLRRTASATAPTLAEAYGRRLFDAEGLSEQTLHGTTGFASVEGRLSAAVTLFVQASAEATGSVLHPLAFSDDVADALRYGDVDDDVNAIAQQSVVFRNGQYARRYATDGGSAPVPLPYTGFSPPGAQVSRYDRQHAGSVQLAGRVTARVGTHRVEVGGEAERQTFRRFVLDGHGLAAYAADDGGPEQSLEAFPDGVARYDQLPFDALRFRVATYGYSFNGTSTTDTEDVDTYFADPRTGLRSSTAVAPFQPVTAAGYVRDRFEAGPASVDLGLRVSLYDARATTLFDPYAPFPILRAEDLDDRPAGIGGDFAVYEAFGNQTVGFRDREGQFYDESGRPTSADEVLNQRRGQPRGVDAPRSEAFTTTDAAVRLEPRLSVRLRASERVTVTAHAMRLTRRPDPSLFVPFSVYEELGGGRVLPGNAALRPETVDAAGVGVAAIPTPSLTLSAEAFLRHRRAVARTKRFTGSFPEYVGVGDDGAVDDTGLDLAAQWSPTRTLTVSGVYGLATARSADLFEGLFATIPGADARPAAGDVRHALDVVLDLRIPDGAGPLGGVGLGLVVAAQSGMPYTALQPNTGFSVFDAFTVDAQGSLNSARLPWTSQVDLRVQKRFVIGAASVTAFAWAENVFGARNTLAVYRSTGEPDEDGYLSTATGATGTPAQQLLYAAYISGPVNVGGRQSTDAQAFYGRPRQVRLGVVLGL